MFTNEWRWVCMVVRPIVGRGAAVGAGVVRWHSACTLYAQVSILVADFVTEPIVMLLASARGWPVLRLGDIWIAIFKVALSVHLA